MKFLTNIAERGLVLSEGQILNLTFTLLPVEEKEYFTTPIRNHHGKNRFVTLELTLKKCLQDCYVEGKMTIQMVNTPSLILPIKFVCIYPDEPNKPTNVTPTLDKTLIDNFKGMLAYFEGCVTKPEEVRMVEE